ncbi:MAG: hypothetical protein PWP24_168 [Clostridiales bacterium]|nr:hypothetical protein [Clostridiales bacterium]
MFSRIKGGLPSYGESRQNETKIIGILGASRGVGVTHVCILLAEYLAIEKGAKVALIACNHHGDFTNLMYNLGAQGAFPFCHHYVDYYNEDSDGLVSIKQNVYSYVVMDFGARLTGKSELFRSCDKKILLETKTLWKRGAAKWSKDFMEENEVICLCNFNTDSIAYTPISKRPEKKLRKIFDEICMQ